jgi:hypothetical protein
MRFWPKIQVRKNDLLSDESGGAIIEAALGLPILLTSVIGIFEVAHFYFVTAAVENAVLHASRYGITGNTEEGSTRLEKVTEVIEQQTFGSVDMDTIEIETLVYDQFSDIGEPEPFSDDNDSGDWDEGEAYTDVNGNGSWDDDMAQAGLGGGGDIVLYRIRYKAYSLSGFANWATTAIDITSTVAVRNEPY